MNEKDKSILRHIAEYCGRLLEYTDGIDESSFVIDSLRIDACALGILQIGELVRLLSDDFKASYPSIPWKLIRAMRNVIAHHYGEVDAETLWETIITDVPPLKKFCESILAIENGNTGIPK